MWYEYSLYSQFYSVFSLLFLYCELGLFYLGYILYGYPLPLLATQAGTDIALGLVPCTHT